MRFPLHICCILALQIALTTAATTYELEAKNFIDNASARTFRLYNRIAEATIGSPDSEDFEEALSKLANVETIAKELVQISQEAAEFDLSRIKDEQIKRALRNLHKAADLFVLGEDYFSSMLINLAALKGISTDKDIEPYLGGANMPNQADTPIAYYPDIQRIFQKSNDSDELKYYWETWRDKNVNWASINFYIIVESIQKAAKMLDLPVLEFWYRYYENSNFLHEMEVVMDELAPAYKEMHAFIRYELVKKYGEDVIDVNGPIPDHLYEQVLVQAWTDGSIIEAYFPYNKLPPYDQFVQNFSAIELFDESQRFYKSLGFKDLDDDFRTNRLKELSKDSSEGDCRAIFFDLTPQVYMSYCKDVDFRKFMQNHGYLARLHYALGKSSLPSYFFNSYDLTSPVGEAIILSASTPKHLSAIGLAKDFEFKDEVLMNRLFRMAIHTIFKIPSYFVHTKVLNDLLNGTVDMEGLNKYYWQAMEKYAGVEPPLDRSEADIDFPHKFYFDIEQGHQTKKFVAEVLGYQFYSAFCKKSGSVSLHNCDFYGNLAVGNDLKSMIALGSSKPWRDVLATILPENNSLSAAGLLEYYAPILDWIKNKNKENNVKFGWESTKKRII